MPLRNLICVIAGLLTGLAFVPVPGDSRMLSQVDAAPVMGGACPNIGCVDKTCATNGACPRGWTAFCEKADGKCRKTASNSFARCGDANSQMGFTCTEQSNGGCIALMTGDVNAGNNCPEAQCVKSASCGTTAYTCTGTACGS